MNLCIYCNIREATSKEHYLPACLGNFRNFEVLTDKLCSICNNKIGIIEEQFCRCGPEAFFRRMIGFKGRKTHIKINPFYRGSAGGKRIVMMTDHPTYDCHLFCETAEGEENAYPARQVIIRDKNLKYFSILISENIKNPNDFKVELDKLGGCDFEPVEIWALSEDDIQWIKDLLMGAGLAIPCTNEISYGDFKDQKFVITFTVNDNYFRAIAKIGFHYFLANYKQYTGFEVEFYGIKNFIMNGGNPDNWVRQIEGSFVYGLVPGKTTTNRYAHLMSVDKGENSIWSNMSFFVGPKGLPSYYYRVCIGKDPSKIIYNQPVGHQFVYFETEDAEGYVGRVDPMRSISRSLLL